jgi:signal transduction histidine kinase
VESAEENDWLEIRVSDQGRGVADSQRQVIFQRFKQLCSSDATEKGGSGLGLSICKAIVEAHGGSIGVESEIGKGSTFWFRLPLFSEA